MAKNKTHYEFIRRSINRIRDDGGNQITKRFIQAVVGEEATMLEVIALVAELEGKGFLRIIRPFSVCKIDEAFAEILREIPERL